MEATQNTTENTTQNTANNEAVECPVWTIENERTHKIFKITNPQYIHSIKIHHTNATGFKATAAALGLTGKYCIELVKEEPGVVGEDLMYVIDGIPTRTQVDRDFKMLAVALRDKSYSNAIIRLNSIYHTQRFKNHH